MPHTVLVEDSAILNLTRVTVKSRAIEVPQYQTMQVGTFSSLIHKGFVRTTQSLINLLRHYTREAAKLTSYLLVSPLEVSLVSSSHQLDRSARLLANAFSGRQPDRKAFSVKVTCHLRVVAGRASFKLYLDGTCIVNASMSSRMCFHMAVHAVKLCAFCFLTYYLSQTEN